jgi:hypothetical protein
VPQLAPSVFANYGANRTEHNLVDAQVADKRLRTKQVVVLDGYAERQSLDRLGLRGHLDTMVLVRAVDAVYGRRAALVRKKRKIGATACCLNCSVRLVMLWIGR